MGVNFEQNWVPLKYNFIQQYQTTVDTRFFAIQPVYLKSSMLLVRHWLEWANGYSPEWHNNYIPTHLGSAIVDLATSKVFGSRVAFDVNARLGDREGAVTAGVREFADTITVKSRYQAACRQAIWYAFASGTSIVKADVMADGNIKYTPVRQDKFYVNIVANKVVGMKCCLQVLTGNGERDRFAIVEERKYSRKGEPIGRYMCYKLAATNPNDTWMLGEPLQYKDLPIDAQQALSEYSMAVVGNLGKTKPLYIGKDNKTIGVYLFKASEQSKYFDATYMGDSILSTVLELLAEYDKAWTEMSIDLSLGRGQVLIPDDIAPSISGNTGEDERVIDAILKSRILNETIFKAAPYINPEEQKPVSIQFELRAQEWQSLFETMMKEICVRVGISASTLATHLADQAVKTATEVTAEENNTIAFINDKRALFQSPMDEMAQDLYESYGLPGMVFVVWSKAGFTNVRQISDMVIAQYQSGLRSLKSSVQMLNVDATSSDIQEELDRVEGDKAMLGAGDPLI